MEKRSKNFEVTYELTSNDGNSFTSYKNIQAYDEEHAEGVFIENEFPLGIGREGDELNEELRNSLNILSIEEEVA